MSATEINNRLMFIYCCIGAFAKKHSLTNAQAYRYLLNFNGLNFIDEEYDVEHTFSIDNAVDDMAAVCRQHGGMLS